MREFQQQRILALLEERAPSWVGLHDILDLRIANYRARISELRVMLLPQGIDIQNKTEYCGRVKHSWYRLVRRERAVA